jgi:hypothetical protein
MVSLSRQMRFCTLWHLLLPTGAFCLDAFQYLFGGGRAMPCCLELGMNRPQSCEHKRQGASHERRLCQNLHL